MKLTVNVTGLELKNPIILASAGYTYSHRGLERYSRKGFSAVVTKTVSWTKTRGTDPPRTFYEKGRWMTGLESGWNPGYKKMAEYIKMAKKKTEKEGCYIIGSLAGSTLEEWAKMSAELEAAGASAIEMNMGCPASVIMSSSEIETAQFKQKGCTWSAEPRLTVSAIKAVKGAVDIPVWAKINVGDNSESLLVPENVKSYESAGADAFCFVGAHGLFRYSGMFLDVETGREYSYPRRKFCMGPLIEPFTIRRTFDIAKAATKPLIPSGGFIRGNDVIRAFMVGASAVEVCSVVYWDPNIVGKMLKEVERYMSKHGYSSFDDIKGYSLKLGIE